MHRNKTVFKENSSRNRGEGWKNDFYMIILGELNIPMPEASILEESR